MYSHLLVALVLGSPLANRAAFANLYEPGRRAVLRSVRVWFRAAGNHNPLAARHP